MTFSEEKASMGPAKYNRAESELDLSDDEAEQDEVLCLDTFTQEQTSVKSVTAVSLTEAKDSNNCTDIVPLFPAASKKSSISTDLVALGKSDSRTLTSSTSGLMANKAVPRLPLLGLGRSTHSTATPSPRPPVTSGRPAAVTVTQGSHGGQQGVLKLNVAIAGEFSMGNFSPGQ